MEGLAQTLAEKVASNTLPPHEQAVKADNMTLGLAKEAALRKLQLEDKPLEDSTAQLLIMAQGPKAFTYISPELTSTLRVANSIKTSDPMRLTGVPTKKEIKEAAENFEKMEKLKWKLTGNGIKADAWANSYGGE